MAVGALVEAGGGVGAARSCGVQREPTRAPTPGQEGKVAVKSVLVVLGGFSRAPMRAGGFACSQVIRVLQSRGWVLSGAAAGGSGPAARS